MVEKIKKSDNIHSYLGLILVAFTFPLPYQISNLVLALLVILWVVEGGFGRKIGRINQKKSVWLITSFYLLHVFSLLYTEDISHGLSILEKNLPLILFPFIIVSINIPSNGFKYILLSFVLGNFLASIYLLSWATVHFILSGSCEGCFYHKFTSPLDLHAIYFSLFLLFSLFIIIDYRRLIQNLLRKTANVVFTVMLLVLSSALILSASKTLIISFLVFLPIFLLVQHRKILDKGRKRAYILVFILYGICFFSILFLKPIKERFSTNFDFSSLKYLEIVGTDRKLSNTQKAELNGATLRILLMKIGINKIIEDKDYCLGYGPGDVNEKLNEEYYVHNMAPNWFFDYNVHNQYVQTFLELGVPGISCLLILLGFGLYSSIKNQDYLYSFFIIITSINFLSEVVLGRNKGIVFFAFFYALFLFSNTKREGKV